MLESKYYLHLENEKKCEEVNIKLNILIEFKIHDTIGFVVKGNGIFTDP